MPMLRLRARIQAWRAAALVLLHALQVAADSSADFAEMIKDAGQLPTSATTYRERIGDSDVSALIAAIQRAHSHRVSGRAVRTPITYTFRRVDR